MSTSAGIHEVQIVQQVKLHKEVHAWLENLVHSRRTILVKEVPAFSTTVPDQFIIV
jgi:hypothetical protein